jgi:hypothetical protein
MARTGRLPGDRAEAIQSRIDRQGKDFSPIAARSTALIIDEAFLISLFDRIEP